ncbi:energy-coupling factor transporter transmembrane protein EcfT [Thalassobius sp. Cn5-15]|uniref:energy-coupling factor transporter transmembrane component T family protein n=1 Tax=Thalassobius sp. Cn5-15 TaxID=2917763 RepID=UPI001EF23273|nr:energy-coupling factor transporter transmembrane component T [Thalassobius sp. Cn5-15]MCG7493540.1 energy-coupling factor transporter transmembrane protein EcfT [Thalassobius sp. Cn5-15]
MISLTSEVRTPYHHWWAGPKLLGLCLFTVVTFYLDTPLSSGGVLAVLALCYLICGVRFARQGLRLLRPLVWVCVIIMGYHIAIRDIADGAVVCLRLGAAVAAANLVTLTTQLDEMLAVLERLMARLRVSRRIRRRIALAVALVIRFIPELTRKGGTLIEAWRARSTKKFSWKLLLPFALLALDDAEQVAEALKARGGVE